MKKFHFSLETVLSYKQQVLDAQQAEHATILAAVNEQEAKLQQLHGDYSDYAQEYRDQCASGMDISSVRFYQAGLRMREIELEREADRLKVLHSQEEAKRMEVVAAKQDTSSIEKLREKQVERYNVAVAKSEEQFIEEFVSMQRCVAAG